MTEAEFIGRLATALTGLEPELAAEIAGRCGVPPWRLRQLDLAKRNRAVVDYAALWLVGSVLAVATKFAEQLRFPERHRLNLAQYSDLMRLIELNKGKPLSAANIRAILSKNVESSC